MMERQQAVGSDFRSQGKAIAQEMTSLTSKLSDLVEERKPPVVRRPPNAWKMAALPNKPEHFIPWMLDRFHKVVLLPLENKCIGEGTTPYLSVCRSMVEAMAEFKNKWNDAVEVDGCRGCLEVNEKLVTRDEMRTLFHTHDDEMIRAMCEDKKRAQLISVDTPPPLPPKKNKAKKDDNELKEKKAKKERSIKKRAQKKVKREVNDAVKEGMKEVKVKIEPSVCEQMCWEENFGCEMNGSSSNADLVEEALKMLQKSVQEENCQVSTELEALKDQRVSEESSEIDLRSREALCDTSDESSVQDLDSDKKNTDEKSFPSEGYLSVTGQWVLKDKITANEALTRGLEWCREQDDSALIDGRIPMKEWIEIIDSVEALGYRWGEYGYFDENDFFENAHLILKHYFEIDKKKRNYGLEEKVYRAWRSYYENKMALTSIDVWKYPVLCDLLDGVCLDVNELAWVRDGGLFKGASWRVFVFQPWLDDHMKYRMAELVEDVVVEAERDSGQIVVERLLRNNDPTIRIFILCKRDPLGPGPRLLEIPRKKVKMYGVQLGERRDRADSPLPQEQWLFSRVWSLNTSLQIDQKRKFEDEQEMERLNLHLVQQPLYGMGEMMGFLDACGGCTVCGEVYHSQSLTYRVVFAPHTVHGCVAKCICQGHYNVFNDCYEKSFFVILYYSQRESCFMLREHLRRDMPSCLKATEEQILEVAKEKYWVLKDMGFNRDWGTEMVPNFWLDNFVEQMVHRLVFEPEPFFEPTSPVRKLNLCALSLSGWSQMEREKGIFLEYVAPWEKPILNRDAFEHRMLFEQDKSESEDGLNLNKRGLQIYREMHSDFTGVGVRESRSMRIIVSGARWRTLGYYPEGVWSKHGWPQGDCLLDELKCEHGPFNNHTLCGRLPKILGMMNEMKVSACEEVFEYWKRVVLDEPFNEHASPLHFEGTYARLLKSVVKFAEDKMKMKSNVRNGVSIAVECKFGLVSGVNPLREQISEANKKIDKL